MTARITVASLAPLVAQQGEVLAQQGEALSTILGILTAQQAQPSTPTAVADAVVETPATPAPAKPSASDELLAFVVEKGLAFAKGGRTYLDAEMLKAQVRVLKTGKPEVLPYKDGTGQLLKRGVTHIAIGRTEDGKATFTQFVYTPDAE